MKVKYIYRVKAFMDTTGKWALLYESPNREAAYDFMCEFREALPELSVTFTTHYPNGRMVHAKGWKK